MFSHPKELKIKEEFHDDKDVVGSNHIPHPYYSITADIPFITKYDTWRWKSFNLIIRDSEEKEFYASGGEKIKINDKEFLYTKSYQNYDSPWAQQRKDVTESESVDNEARVDYFTITKSYCYYIGFLMSGTGPKSEDMYGKKNPTYPANSKEFFDSELGLFNNILNTVVIKN